jgi:predicted metal-dependent enzyme (double-stranded beta helix superfamily)
VTALDDPVRTLLERIAAPAAASTPDLPAIGVALAGLAGDRDYLAHWIARLEGRPGAVLLHGTTTGPRLQLVHRPTGGVSAVHDHGTWVAVATIAGLETHRRYRLAARADDGRPWPTLEDEVALEASQVATLLPPDDIHDHGHLVGRGEAAHILVLTGDDQRRYSRTEWDLATGRQRTLRPGDGGRWLASDPWPST